MNRIKVVVTGAAGQIGYSLIPRLVDGHTFGNSLFLALSGLLTRGDGSYDDSKILVFSNREVQRFRRVGQL